MHVGVPATSDGRRPVAILAQGVGAIFWLKVGSTLAQGRRKFGAICTKWKQYFSDHVQSFWLIVVAILAQGLRACLDYGCSHFGSRLECHFFPHPVTIHCHRLCPKAAKLDCNRSSQQRCCHRPTSLSDRIATSVARS